MTLATFVALCSAVLAKPLQQQMVVLGSMSLGGNVVPVENLAESLQVGFDAGAKRLLLPMASVKDIATIPGGCSPSSKRGFTLTRQMRYLRRWEWGEKEPHPRMARISIGGACGI
jgi:ATP-dependent Lon protease